MPLESSTNTEFLLSEKFTLRANLLFPYCVIVLPGTLIGSVLDHRINLNPVVLDFWFFNKWNCHIKFLKQYQ